LPPASTLFPYTTLFRSGAGVVAVDLVDLRLDLFDQAVLTDVLLALLVDGGVEEERQDGRRRAVDGHGHRGLRVAEVETGVELLGDRKSTRLNSSHVKIS